MHIKDTDRLIKRITIKEPDTLKIFQIDKPYLNHSTANIIFLASGFFLSLHILLDGRAHASKIKSNIEKFLV